MKFVLWLGHCGVRTGLSKETMEQNRNPGNRPMHMCTLDFWQGPRQADFDKGRDKIDSLPHNIHEKSILCGL